MTDHTIIRLLCVFAVVCFFMLIDTWRELDKMHRRVEELESKLRGKVA